MKPNTVQGFRTFCKDCQKDVEAYLTGASAQWTYADLKSALDRDKEVSIGHPNPDHRWPATPQERERLRIAASKDPN
jgi:hypothetical protein